MSVKKSETALAERIGRKKLRGIKYLLLAVPFLIYVFAFSYVPLVGWIYSVFDYKIGQKFLDFGSMVFVGLGNFQKLFTERSEVLRVLRNTLALSALGLLATPVPVVFAIMFNEIKILNLKNCYRHDNHTAKHLFSWIIVYGVAFAFFSVNGFVSVLMQKIGIQPPVMGILGDVDHTWVLQWILGIWKSFGWSAIIYIAAITGIDSELYDAAKVDGANKLQSILHITIPGIMPTYVVMFLLAVSNILSNGFDQYFMFYNPMVADKIEVLDYYVYKVGFYINDYSYSITLGMLKSILGIVLLFTANALSEKNQRRIDCITGGEKNEKNKFKN